MGDSDGSNHHERSRASGWGVGATSGRWQQLHHLASGAAAVAVRAETAGAGRALAISTLILHLREAQSTCQLHAAGTAFGLRSNVELPAHACHCDRSQHRQCRSGKMLPQRSAAHTHAVVWARGAVARGIHREAKVAGLHGECAAFLEAYQQGSQEFGDNIARTARLPCTNSFLPA